MAWDVRRTYYYLVCFATLLMVIIGTAQAVGHALDLALPDRPTQPSPLDLYERKYARPMPPGAGVPDTTFTIEELERMAAEQADAELARQRRYALRRLLGSLALVLIALPVYLYHWRPARQL